MESGSLLNTDCEGFGLIRAQGRNYKVLSFKLLSGFVWWMKIIKRPAIEGMFFVSKYKF